MKGTTKIELTSLGKAQTWMILDETVSEMDIYFNWALRYGILIKLTVYNTKRPKLLEEISQFCLNVRRLSSRGFIVSGLTLAIAKYGVGHRSYWLQRMSFSEWCRTPCTFESSQISDRSYVLEPNLIFSLRTRSFLQYFTCFYRKLS